jgi:tRNA (guanine-N7-)-methyltransferase
MSGPPTSGRSARTFKPRRGRLSGSETEAVETLLPRYRLAPSVEPLTGAGLVFDVGFGNGETTVALAERFPGRTVIAIDVHTPGLGVLARTLSGRGIDNVRIVDADALDVLTWMCGPGQASYVNVSFPDPWPKAGQQHRRLVDRSFADLVATRMCLGGVFSFASDWQPYADVVDEVLGAHSDFEPTEPWTDRPETKYERRGKAAGRVITNLSYERR